MGQICNSILFIVIFAIPCDKPKNHFQKLTADKLLAVLRALSPRQFGLSTSVTDLSSSLPTSDLFSIYTSFAGLTGLSFWNTDPTIASPKLKTHTPNQCLQKKQKGSEWYIKPVQPILLEKAPIPQTLPKLPNFQPFKINSRIPIVPWIFKTFVTLPIPSVALNTLTPFYSRQIPTNHSRSKWYVIFSMKTSQTLLRNISVLLFPHSLYNRMDIMFKFID